MIDFPGYTFTVEKTKIKIPDHFKTLLSPCCNVRVIDSGGCVTCKLCPECKRFLGCWNLAGYELDETGEYYYIVQFIYRRNEVED